MLETVTNVLHHPNCNGTHLQKSFKIDKGFTPKEITLEKKCGLKRVVSFSYNYEVYHLRLADCFMSKMQDYEVVKEYLINVFNKDVISFRTSQHIPKWEGESWVYEIVYETLYRCYCVKTELDKIPNVWQNEESLKVIEENYAYDSYDLIEKNIAYLGSNDFVSKRASVYEITQTDINKMFKKFKMQINS